MHKCDHYIQLFDNFYFYLIIMLLIIFFHNIELDCQMDCLCFQKQNKPKKQLHYRLVSFASEQTYMPLLDLEIWSREPDHLFGKALSSRKSCHRWSGLKNRWISGYSLVLNCSHKCVQNREQWTKIKFLSTCANFKVLSMHS